MANKIVFDYEAMKQCVSEIREIMGRYTSAAKTFNSDFNSAIAEWEGDSKDKMKMFIDNAVNEYLAESIPSIVEALATILEENAKQMSDADFQIAEKIPQSLSESN